LRVDISYVIPAARGIAIKQSALRGMLLQATKKMAEKALAAS
jgi:hypothetical protein